MKIQIENRCNSTNKWILKEYSFAKSAKLLNFKWHEHFIPIAKIDLNKSKGCGYDFNYVSTSARKKDKATGWVYLITVDGKIIKIGGTKTELKKRFASYSAGTRKNRDSGTCSTTNYIVSECFRKILSQFKNANIVIYGRKIEVPKVSIPILGRNKCLSNMKIDLYTEYETAYINEHAKQFGQNPALSFNKGE